MLELSPASRRALWVQRNASLCLAPLWVPLLGLVMRFGLRWRIEGAEAVRRQYAALRRESSAPLLVCANHLTMLDSFVIAWALGTPGFYLRDFGALPWNTPERTHFASTWWKSLLVWVFKCVPIRRGAERSEVGLSLAKIHHVMQQGEVALIFPEGRRSRTGRVEVQSAAYGVGRLVNALPGCRVLCLYLRGRSQESYSTAPVRGEHFDALASVLEPKSDHGGVRGSVAVARQIVGQLADLERRVLDDRQ